jgi:multidrug efflux pump subunit AcrB
VNLSQLAFARRPVVYLVVVAAMLFGAVSYFTLPAREDPKITNREATVVTHYPGLAAERVELLITKTLEEAIRQVPEVEELRSTSAEGQSIIHVEVGDSYFELDQVWDEVRDRVARAREALPAGAQAPVVNDAFGDVAVVTAALTARDFTPAESFDMAQHIRDRLFAVPGTKRVELLGAREERIFIEPSSARLAELGIAPGQLIAALREQNIIRPGGSVDTLGRAIVLEPSGNVASVADLRSTLVSLSGRRQVLALGELAAVTRGYREPPGRRAYFNGEPAIVFAISMAEGRSVLDFGERVRDALGRIEAGLPVGYSLDIATFQAEQVANAVFGVTRNVLQTLAIVLAVVVLFLGLRTGLIVGAIVPTVMLLTLAVMGARGMALERMSLATLVIALGLLVDNGIVIAEDFKRRLEAGTSRDDALAQTGGQLAFPLLSSTLTTILVFLPLMLADHVSGEYTRSISLVIFISLLASWLVAMCLTPVLCHRFLAQPAGDGRRRRAGVSDRLFSAMAGPYERLLRVFLGYRWLTLAAAVALLAAALYALGQVPQKFFPDSDRAQVLVYVDLPAGSSSRETDATIRTLAAVAGDDERFPQVEDTIAYVGFGGPRFVLSLTPVDPAPQRGFLVLNIDRYEHLGPAIEALRPAFAAAAPAAQVRVQGMFLGPSDSSVLELQLKGPDAEHLYTRSRELEALLVGLPRTINVRSDWENRITRVHGKVDQARARRAGVTSADVARALESHFEGRRVTEFRDGDDVFPVVARAPAAERHDFERMQTIPVYAGATGRYVPLFQVASFEPRNGFGVIAREALTRTVSVQARNTRYSAEDLLPMIAGRLDALEATLAPGHWLEVDGVVAQSREGRAALAANIPLCLAAIVLLLVVQFNDYRRPAIILATVPLLLIGATLGLHLTGANFGFMVILGLYALAGILINNAIVLIDRIDIERWGGDHAFDEAVVAASVRRLRPVLMTTVTTILGLLPLIVFKDALFFGMAVVIAFGLAVGTILTLVVVPVLYGLFVRH